ncbi:hypothetical protein [Cystobacter ferrugineus]|uniref:Uncharacterized protein n=1 Tax=Cystobacter ferrugineus TaxID=83449 RepID=A0A1L9BE22_9BACT|nr:hypothetical protein [Cystobacter ferrugineus]OJH40500.1 hypothetical protein BON30_15980 [Cystobacter ferrugineus]
MEDDIPSAGERRLIGDEDYAAALGEDLSFTLDLRTWEKGWEIERLISRIRSQVVDAETAEARIRTAIRNEILPGLRRQAHIPEAGVYEASPKRLNTVFDSKLFAGRVEAVNSIAASHDSLSLGITQIGVAVVGYGGLSGTFSQRLFRKDVTTQEPDVLKVVQDCLERRHERGSRDRLSMLMRRYIRAYAERAILLDRSQAEWRIGPGNPCSREMLSGANYKPLLKASLGVLRRLIREHKKFVFVHPALDEQGYLTIGDALKAGEYAILHTLEEDSAYFVERWHYDDRMGDEALAFVRECCPDVLIGLFRASEQAPPRLFYAHREHVHIAAHIAMADSILRPERGFPMLLDVADAACRGVFGSESFLGLVNDAYTRAGSQFHYFGGR